MRWIPALPVLALALAACSGGANDQAAANNQISQDPFGATGAPGSDLTDNGVTDGASGLADNGQAGQPLSNAGSTTRK